MTALELLAVFFSSTYQPFDQLTLGHRRQRFAAYCFQFSARAYTGRLWLLTTLTNTSTSPYIPANALFSTVCGDCVQDAPKTSSLYARHRHCYMSTKNEGSFRAAATEGVPFCSYSFRLFATPVFQVYASCLVFKQFLCV